MRVMGQMGSGLTVSNNFAINCCFFTVIRYNLYKSCLLRLWDETHRLQAVMQARIFWLPALSDAELVKIL